MLIHCKMPSLIMELHFPASSSFSKKRVMLTIHPHCHQMARIACFNTAIQPGMTTNILRKKKHDRCTFNHFEREFCQDFFALMKYK